MSIVLADEVAAGQIPPSVGTYPDHLVDKGCVTGARGVGVDGDVGVRPEC